MIISFFFLCFITLHLLPWSLTLTTLALLHINHVPAIFPKWRWHSWGKHIGLLLLFWTVVCIQYKYTEEAALSIIFSPSPDAQPKEGQPASRECSQPAPAMLHRLLLNCCLTHGRTGLDGASGWMILMRMIQFLNNF